MNCPTTNAATTHGGPVAQKPRGARTVDLLLAATAVANQLPIYTRNLADFVAIDGLVEVHAI